MRTNKTFSILFTVALILSLTTSAFAANMDIYNIETNEVYRYDEFIADDEQFNNVISLINENPSNYLYEYNDVGYNFEELNTNFGETGNLEDALEKTKEVPLPKEDLEVANVSAIDKTIELNVASFEAEEDATAKVAIFALDDEGVKTGTAMVTANTAEIVDNVVTFDVSSKTFGDDEYVIEVTIGDVTETVNVALEFDAVETLVADINAATAAQLATLLADEAYFTGFDVAKVDAYKANVTGTHKTVAEVQELVIDAVAATAEFDAFVAELTDAEVTSEYAKYLVLKGQFSNVLDANMDAYMNTAGPIFNGDLDTIAVAMTDFDAISDAIDVINLDAVVASDGVTVDADAVPSELNAYKAALTALVLVNDEVVDTNGDTKAEIIEAIDTQLEAIETDRTAADEEIVDAQAALAAFETANGGAPTAAHTEYDAVVTAIEALDDEDLTETQITTATGTLTAAITALEGKTEELTIIDDTIAALAAFEAAFEVNNATAGNLEAEYIAVTANFTDFANEDYSYDTANSKDIDTLKADLVTLKAETAEWETYNAVIAATTATEMRTLLFEFADTVNDDYLNLTSAQKTEFAGRFIETLADEDDVRAKYNFANLEAIFQTDVPAYMTLITDVNEAANITEMIADLTALGNDAFDALTTAEKASIAETVLAGQPYATLADIEAAMGL